MPSLLLRSRSRFSALLTILSLVLSLVAAVASPQRVAAAGGPFSCTPGLFQVLSGQLNKLNPVTGVYTPVGAAYADTYNAMGYNVLDNYLYAIDTSGHPGHLLRIASDGSITDLGLPAGLPAAGFIAGDFDASGHLIVQSSGTTWYSIDVSALTASTLTITGSTGTANDMVWIGGSMYLLSGATPTLRRVNLSTLVATTASVSGITGGSGSYGAGWSDRPDDLFFSDNSGNGIFKITGFTGATPSATKVANGASTGNNDGAACKLADSPFNGPAAVDDSYSFLAGQPFSANAASGLIANDTGTPPITINSHTSPAHGTLTLNSDGSFSFSPTAGYSGPDSFTYTDADPYGRLSGSGTVTLSILPAPQDQTYVTPLNTPVARSAPGLLSGAVGSTLTLTSHTAPGHGAASVNADGSFSYTPDANHSGVDSFQYTVQDSADQTASATVTVQVLPSAQPDAYGATDGTPLSVTAPGVLGNDVGTALTVTAFTPPGHGSVSVNPDGSFTYTAAANFSGTDTFQYTASDSSGLTGTATVTLSVQPGAGNPTYTTPASTPLSVVAGSGLVAGSDGSGLTVTGNGSPSHGTVSVSPDGSFSYTPTAGYSGPDGFSYTVTDSGDQNASGSVTLHVTPVANGDTYTTPFQTALTVDPGTGVLGNDLGTGLSASAASPPSHGTVSMNGDGSFSYTPDAGFAGTDTFQYQVTDGSGQVAPVATVTVDVGTPPPPVANSQGYSTPVSTALVVAAPGVMSGDAGYGITVTGHTAPQYGTLTIAADGHFTYSPTAGYSGPDSFSYTVTDSFGQTSTATVTLSVTPVAGGDTYETPFQTALTVTAPGVLGNDHGSSLTVVQNTAPAHGTAVVNADGSLTYTPDAGYAGGDSLTYTVADSSDQTATATVTLTVDLPAAPAAADDSASGKAGTTLTADAPGVLGNDAGYALTVTGTTSPSHGSVTVNADGSYAYTPSAGYSGPDSFAYTVTDGFGRTSTATVSLDVTPNALDDVYSTPFQTPLTVAAPGLLGNDLGSSLTVLWNSPATDGSVVANSDGSLTYTPDAGYAGTDSFVYMVSDSSGGLGLATVTVTVDLPAAPVAAGDSGTVAAGGTLTVGTPGVLGNDTGYQITVTGSAAPTHGSATVNADGSYSYTPTGGYSGPDGFSYTVTDGFGRTSTATVTLAVTPVANGDTYTTPFETPLVVGAGGGLLGNDVGTGLTASVVSGPSHGSLSLNGDGSFRYTPDAGYAGADSFLYRATDGAEQGAVAGVSLGVSIPAPPVAGNQSYTTPANTALVVGTPGVMSGDAGYGITVTGHSAPAHGTLTIAADGHFTDTPQAGYSGVDGFSYTITDGFGQTSSAVVTVLVTPIAAAASAQATAPAAITLPLPAPQGSGPFTWQLVGTPPARTGTATLNPTTGLLVFTPAPGFSGTVPGLTYAVTDSGGLLSNTAPVTLTLATPPPPAPVRLSGTTAFGTTIVVTPPAPGGVGPNRYALVASTLPPASAGTLSIDPVTGSITFVPAPGYSGRPQSFLYSVTDAYGQSVTAAVDLTVDPAGQLAEAQGPAGAPITVQPPAPHGVGPFTYQLVAGSLPPAADGTVTMDAHTGAVTFTPAPGFSGLVSVRYTVTDGAGVTSPPATVTFDVKAVSVEQSSTGPASVVPAPEAGAMIDLRRDGLLVGSGLLILAAAVLRRSPVDDDDGRSTLG